MTPRVHISAAAQRDIADAKAWYAGQHVSDLDLRFQQELEHILRQIEAFPAGFQIAHHDIRKANLHRFPYSVFFHLRGEILYVLAVSHHSRHPRIWQRRR